MRSAFHHMLLRIPLLNEQSIIVVEWPQMNPQRAVVARQSMSASLQNLRDRINDERARIERALKNPGAVMIPKSASEPTTPLKLSSEVIDVPRQEPKSTTRLVIWRYFAFEDP